MNVLSLFDGMSCGQIALKELGVPIGKYYASEIDQHAIRQTQLNFPTTIQLGDVTQWRTWDIDWASIDLLLAGSPCQGFSTAGKMLGHEDPRSRLYWTFLDILRHIQSVNPRLLWLLENVRMRPSDEQRINDSLGLRPVVINSALVSAQNRVRLYWSNIRTRREGLWGECVTDIPQPKDRGILIRHILEKEVDAKYHLSPRAMQWVKDHSVKRGKTKLPIADDRDKGVCLTVSNTTKYNLDANFVLVPHQKQDDPIITDPYIAKNYRHTDDKAHALLACTYKGVKSNGTTIISQPMVVAGTLRSFKRDKGFRPIAGEKSPCLTARARQDGSGQACIASEVALRRLTPTECARLQTIPSWYRWACSDTQAYRMLGNGWTVEVIKHILSFINYND